MKGRPCFQHKRMEDDRFRHPYPLVLKQKDKKDKTEAFPERGAALFVWKRMFLCRKQDEEVCRRQETAGRSLRKGWMEMTLEEMKNVDPRTVDRSTLVQRSSVRIDQKLGREERLREYVRQIKNPYCYLDGKTVVKIRFSESGQTLEDCICGYLSGL